MKDKLVKFWNWVKWLMAEEPPLPPPPPPSKPARRYPVRKIGKK
jgi:hypothetical protein